MTALLAIDPGACAGWAWFEDGVLVRCGLSRTKGKTPVARIKDHRCRLQVELERASTIAVERATYRGGRKGAARAMTPAQLADFNLVAGALCVGLQADPVLYTPDEWKGKVPKDTHQPRIWAALTADERALLEAVQPPSLRNNAVDAVGIGLFHLGRLQRKPVTKAPAVRKPARKTKRKTTTKPARKGKLVLFSMKKAA
jgi:hypothetical protein